jgi:hypothetical protein
MKEEFNIFEHLMDQSAELRARFNNDIDQLYDYAVTEREKYFKAQEEGTTKEKN